MSPATQAAFQALVSGLAKSGAIASRDQVSVILKELAQAVPELERRGHAADAQTLEGLVTDLSTELEL